MAGSVNKVILIGNLGRDPRSAHIPERREGLQPADCHVRNVEGQKQR